MTRRRDAVWEIPDAPPSADEPEARASVLDELVADQGVDTAAVAPPRASSPVVLGVCSARLVGHDDQRATLVWRGAADPVDADVAPDVEPELLAAALRDGDRVLVEVSEGERPLVVGVLQTRLRREVRITADEIHLEAAKKLVLRAGRAVIRLHDDGEVELLGTRVNAVSRGLFRLVGRVLRLN